MTDEETERYIGECVSLAVSAAVEQIKSRGDALWFHVPQHKVATGRTAEALTRSGVVFSVDTSGMAFDDFVIDLRMSRQ